MNTILQIIFPHKDVSIINTRFIVLLLINLMASLFGIIFGIIAVIDNQSTLSIIDFSMAIIFLGILFYSYQYPTDTKPYYLTLIICSFFFSYLYLSGGTNGSGYIWSLLIPTGAFLLSGRFFGTIVCISYFFFMLICTVIDYITPIPYLHLPELYSAIRILSVFFLQSIIAFSYEYSREKANNQLVNTDKLLKDITNNIPGMVYQYKILPNGKSFFPYASDMVNELLEVRFDQIKEDARIVIERIYAQDKESVLQSITESQEKLQIWEQEFRFILPHKGLRWVHGIALPKIEEDGSVIWNGLLNDITQHKIYEEKFSAIFASMEEMVVIHRMIYNQKNEPINYIITDCNNAFLKTTGYKHEQVINKLATEVYQTDKAPYLDQYAQVVLNNTSISFSTYYEPMQKYFSISVISHRIDEFVTITTDITEHKQNELLILEERERLQNIIDATNIATWEWNIQTGETIFNERWADIIGYTLQEISPTTIETWAKYAHPDDLEKSNKLLQKHFNNELEYYDFETRMLHKSGEIIWVLDRGKVTKWTHDGKPLLMSGTHQDITQKKLVEKKLSASQDEFKTLFEHSPASIFLHDAETGELINANKTALSTYGVESIDELRENMFWVEPPYSKNDALELIHKTNLVGIHSFEWKARIVTGEYIWQHVTLNQFICQNKPCVIATAIDITKEINNRNLLELTSNVLQILNHPVDLNVILLQTILEIQQKLDCSAIGIRLEKENDYPFIVSHGFSKDFLEKENSLFAKNSDGSIIYNSEKKACLECTCGLICESKAPKNHPLFTSQGSFYTKKSNEILEIPQEQDLRFQARNTCIHFGYKTFALIPIKHNNQIIGLLHIASEKHHYFSEEIIVSLEILVTHISETIIRKQFENELVYTKNQAEEANRAKSMFLANMSHEIRTPLNAIIGFSEILNNSKLENKQKEYSEIIHISSKTLLDLVNDILDFSKIEAGKLEIHMETVDLIMLIENSIDILKLKIKEKNIELITNIHPNTPRFVKTDGLRLSQVLLNLLNNSAKFTHQGNIELQLTFEESTTQSKGLFKFSIIDTGIGIRSEKQSQIFDSFTQADNSTTRTYGGSGLGLSISSSIIQKMGSSIHLQSELGVGSTFSFSLELEYEYEEKTQPEFCNHISRILLIDNNIRIHEFLTNLFQYFNIECICVFDGMSGIKKIESETFDVVIVDSNMPYMDGFQTIESIHKTAQTTTTTHTILMVEINETDSIKHKIQNNHHITSITKPIRINELYNALNNLFIQIPKNQNTIIKETTKQNIPNSYTILIVDDNKFNIMLASTIVKESIPNAIILEAINGEDAIKKYQNQTVDCILMDIQMPIMNGYDAAKQIRKIEKNTNTYTPIIAVSAGTISGENEKSIESGMDAYLPKPIDSKELHNLFKMFLENNPNLKNANSTRKHNTDNEKNTTFDYLMAFEKYHNDDFIWQLIHMAQESIPEYINQLFDAAQQKKSEQMSFAIHTIKGIARSIYFNELYTTCLQIEKTKFLNPEEFSGFAKSISHKYRDIQTLTSENYKNK